MALIFYARVSSKGQNLARQLARAKEVEADKIFKDKFSGKNTNRPGLKTLMKYVREDDTVEVVSLDRLKVKLIVDDLPQTHTGNDLVDQFMLDMMINLMGFVAQNEREKIRERQRQGIEQAKKRGAYKGRPTKFSEDSSDREGRLVFEGIKKDYQSGNYQSKAGLARKYGLSRQQLYRILKRIDQAH